MATNFPTSLDSYNTKTAGDTIEEGHVNNLQDAMVAAETKVGINSSAASSSHDYKLRHLPAQETNLDIGAYKLTAQQLESDIATGTAPLIVASTTLVSNLNADLLDSQEGSYYLDCGNFNAGTLTIARGGTNSVSTTYCNLTANVTGLLPNSNIAAITTASKVNISALYGTTYLPNATVDTTALKTSEPPGEVTVHNASSDLTLPGGEYGFYPRIKKNASYVFASSISIFNNNGGEFATTSYVTNVSAISSDNRYAYIQQRYVTASGTDDFIYVLLDKNTKDIISVFFAPDHPSYGNGGNYEKVPHPFGSYDETKHEIILLDQETCKQLKQESKATIQEEGEQPEKSILTILNEDYKPNMSKKEPYIPLHSGKYKRTLENGKEVVAKHLVETIPNYISVRKLIKLTQAEKDERKRKQKVEQEKHDMAQAQKLINKANGIIKLRKLGLTDKEIEAIGSK